MKMLRVPYGRMLQETRELPDGKLFFVWDEAPASQFLVTVEKQKVWALATKVKGYFYTSDWWKDGESDWKKCLDKAMEQMVLLLKSGWSSAGETQDEFGYPEPLFRCVYCFNETTEPKGTCVCRKIGAILAK